MLTHFQARAEECAMRIQASKSESVRYEYLRIFDRWMKLIAEEQDRLARMDKLRTRRLG